MKRVLALAVTLALSLTITAEASAVKLPNSNVKELPVKRTHKGYGCASDRYVIWTEKSALKAYDLVEKRAFTIPVTKRSSGKPRISDNRVIWSEYSGDATGWDIVGYDLASKKHFVVTKAEGDQGNCNIDGDIVVWVDPDESDDADIYAKNLSTDELFTVSTEPRGQANPDVAGDWVVYDTWAKGGNDIKAYNLRSGVRKTLCGSKGEQYYPRISKTGFVVWQDESSGGPYQMDIRGRYISGGSIRTIAAGAGSQHSPSIDGDLICYFNDRYPGGYGMWGYDLLSNTRFGVASARAESVSSTEINNGTIAWFATNYDVYPLKTRVYIARPVDLEVRPEAPVGIAAAQTKGFAVAKTSTVVIASADSWQDAGVAAAVAGQKSPLLLTSGSTLPKAVSSEIKRLAPTSVVIVGSTRAVPTSVAQRVAFLVPGATVERVAGGSVKSTSFKALARVRERSGWNGTVFICSPSRHAGAVVAAPVASRKGYPIVYVGGSGLTSANVKALKSAGAKRFVIVGAGVPTKVDSVLKKRFGKTSVKRIVGTTSADTSVKFAKWAVSSAGMRWKKVYIGSTSDKKRAIAMASARGRDRGVILLTNGSKLSAPTAKVLKEKDPSIRAGDFIGGSKIVSKTVRKQVRMVVR